VQSLSIRVLGIPVGLYCATDIGSPFYSFFLHVLFLMGWLAECMYTVALGCIYSGLGYIGLWLFLFLVVVAQDVSRVIPRSDDVLIDVLVPWLTHISRDGVFIWVSCNASTSHDLLMTRVFALI
jgi:hypothetical protein